jgi:rhomboid protease GluP
MDEIEFVGSRRSELGKTRRWLWAAVVLVALPIAPLRLGLSTASLVSSVLVLGLFALLDRLIVRTMRIGKRVAMLDAQGIESPLFSTRLKRHAWTDISGAGMEQVQTDRVLQLQLRPIPGRPDRRSFWSGVNPSRPHLSIAALADADQERLLQAILDRVRARNSDVAIAPVNELVEQRLFRERLEALAPRPWLTWVLIALNVLVWAVMALSGSNGMNSDSRTLLEWGANSAFEVVEHGQWWRLLTAAFLHAGAMHLAMNMVGLYSAGVTVERLYGRSLHALIYFGAALVGNGLSLHFSAHRAVSIGASGAVFGVFGAMLVGLYRHHEELPRAFRKQSLTSVGFFIVYSLVQGFASPRIDNAAHVGGLVAGCVLAWLLPRRLDMDRYRAVLRGRALAACVLIAAGVLALGLTASPGVDQRQLSASLQSLERGVKAAEVAGRELQREQEEVAKGRMTELQLDERGRTVHAPKFREALEHLQRVHLPPDDPRSAFAADSLRMTQLIVEMLAMQSDVVDGKPVPARPERFAAAEKELAEVGARIKQHVARLQAAKRR